MTIDSNAFVDNLKTVLAQFELSLTEEKINSEKVRLKRLKKTLAKNEVEIEDTVAITGYTTYAHGLGLSMFQAKTR